MEPVLTFIISEYPFSVELYYQKTSFSEYILYLKIDKREKKIPIDLDFESLSSTINKLNEIKDKLQNSYLSLTFLYNTIAGAAKISSTRFF